MSNAYSAAVLSVLSAHDPEVADLIAAEEKRQDTTLEMIASENHASTAVMAASGSCMTNKYAEGYPGRRYYSGCEQYDLMENLAIERAKKLFNCKFANVQPHSGANANTAVFYALLNPGDTFVSIELSEGGHLTHGSKVSISGRWFKPVHYPLVYDESRADCGYLDYDAIEKICMETKPKLLICGFSAYPRVIDFPRFRAIADKCGALLFCDMAHIAGLVAGGAHPSPFPLCDIVTTTTHKTLRGPRGGLILTNNEEIAKLIDKAVFPGTQGGPLMHIVAAKAVAFAEALKPEFKDYAAQVVKNAKALAKHLTLADLKLSSGGTENHLCLIDLRKTHPDTTGKDAAAWLDSAGIITNKNTVSKDVRSPMQTSGVRLGTPALTTRGLKEADMAAVASIIIRAINSQGDAAVLAGLRLESATIAKKFPMPH